MIKDLFNLFSKQSLLKQSLSDTKKIFSYNKEMLTFIVENPLRNTDNKFVCETDNKVNDLVKKGLDSIGRAMLVTQ